MGYRTVVVAMSGGVDSSVAAALLRREGYRVIGVSLRLFDGEAEGDRACCGIRDVHDARRVAFQLGIPFYLLDFREAFKKWVIDYFVDAYLGGETPNPCVACNRFIKFHILLECCIAWGADLLATGHYARVVREGEEGPYLLLKSRDGKKDQSYFLYMLGQEQLSQLLFPVGDLTKTETRKLAAELGLKVHDKKESQDVCFLGKGGYVALLRAGRREDLRPGPILDEGGELIGMHRGLPLYTIGQRRRLEVDRPGPWYVARLDRERNAVIVSRRVPRSKVVHLREVSMVSGEYPDGPMEVAVRVRYRGREVGARLLPLPGREARLEFVEPAETVAPGQAAVLYRGERVLGGGIIAGSDLTWH